MLPFQSLKSNKCELSDFSAHLLTLGKSSSRLQSDLIDGPLAVMSPENDANLTNSGHVHLPKSQRQNVEDVLQVG